MEKQTHLFEDTMLSEAFSFTVPQNVPLTKYPG